MYSHYPYQFDFQPQLHLRTDYPPHHSYPHSQYQDQQTQQEIQIRGQNQQPRSAQPSHYQFVSTPSTSIDTPTPGYMSCPTTAAAATTTTTTTTTTVTPTMSYFTSSPQQELVFTDPLIRPQGLDASDANVNIHDGDITPAERHYSCDYEYEWGMEQSTPPNSSQAPEQQQHQHQHQQHAQSPYPLQSQQQPLQTPLTYSPSQSIPSSSKPQTQISPPHSQIQSPCQPSSPMTHVPPPRLTRPVRREREQPFKAFHPYANARPTVSVGDKEKEKRRDDSPINRDETPTGSSPVSSTFTTNIPTPSPPTPPSVSASKPVSVAPSPTKTQTQHGQKPNRSLASITIPDPVSAHITTPAPIFGLFGSYPLSRGQALPGPTCAPETSSSVMRLVIAPGALTPNGVAHTAKKEKSEKTTNATAAIAVSSSGPNSTMLTPSVNMGMSMTPALDFSGPATAQILPPNSTSTSTFSVSANAGQNVPGVAAASSSSTSVLNNFNTPTPGLSAAPSSNPNAMAMRKPRMACYFCRKRKIACGPGPEAIALAQEAQARAQAQQQATTTTVTTTTTTVQLEQGEGHGETMSEMTTSTEDSGPKLSSTVESNNNTSTSPTSPTSPSVSTSPVLLSSSPLQTLTGDEGPCNQCARRGLACERPTESKRGVRKGKSKKEKEKEAREKEAKEKELAKKGGDTEKSKKDGNKDQSDDEGGMDNGDDDADMDGNGEADPEERDDGDEVGNGEVVSPTVVSTDPIPLRPLLSPTATSNTPSLTMSGPSSSSIVITKPPNRGRGRPPKHLTYANLNPALAPASSAVASSKGGMKSMTSSFKWTTSTSTTDNKGKIQSRGKGKGKGKKKDVPEVAVEDVALSVSAAVVVKSEDDHRTDSRMEDVHVEVEDEQQPQLESEPLYEDERPGDLLDSDEDMEEETVQRGGGEENVNEPRYDGGEIGSPIDSERSNSSMTPTPTIMNSDIPVQVQLEVQQPPSFSVESSLSPMVPVDSQDPTNVISLSPNETYPMSTQVQVTIPPYDSYGLYAHGHLHSPVVEQHHTQHGYPTPDESVKSSDGIHPHSTTSPYTNADVTMLQEGNSEAYHNSQVSPVFNSHDGMYVMEYSPEMMEQAHGSMTVAHPNLETASVDMRSYYGSGVQSVTDSYQMCVEYEAETGSYDVGMQQQQQHRHQIHHQHSVPLNAEPYEAHAVNGYATDPMSGMGYDHTQPQIYTNTALGNEYDSYGYTYVYGGEYAP